MDEDGEQEICGEDGCPYPLMHVADAGARNQTHLYVCEAPGADAHIHVRDDETPPMMFHGLLLARVARAAALAWREHVWQSRSKARDDNNAQVTERGWAQ